MIYWVVVITKKIITGKLLEDYLEINAVGSNESQRRADLNTKVRAMYNPAIETIINIDIINTQ